MIAAALIIIFVVVRYISSSGQQAAQQTDISALQSQAELAKTNLQAKDLWDADATVTSVSSTQIQVNFDGNTTYTVDISDSPYGGDPDLDSSDANNYKNKNFGDIYAACINQGDAVACKILAALGSGEWQQQ